MMFCGVSQPHSTSVQFRFSMNYYMIGKHRSAHYRLTSRCNVGLEATPFSTDRPTTNTKLQQPWLAIARAIWLLLFVTSVGTTIILIPFIFNLDHHPRPTILNGLQQLG